MVKGLQELSKEELFKVVSAATERPTDTRVLLMLASELRRRTLLATEDHLLRLAAKAEGKEGA